MRHSASLARPRPRPPSVGVGVVGASTRTWRGLRDPIQSTVFKRPATFLLLASYKLTPPTRQLRTTHYEQRPLSLTTKKPPLPSGSQREAEDSSNRDRGERTSPGRALAWPRRRGAWGWGRQRDARGATDDGAEAARPRQKMWLPKKVLRW